MNKKLLKYGKLRVGIIIKSDPLDGLKYKVFDNQYKLIDWLFEQQFSTWNISTEKLDNTKAMFNADIDILVTLK